MTTNPTPSTRPDVPVDACSIAGPNGTRIPTEEGHAWVSRKGPDNIWVRTCQSCPAIDWDDLREGVLAFAAAQGEFKETAENLNVGENVQGNLNAAPVPSDTNRLAEIAARLADLDAKIKLRAENAKRGIVTPIGAAADRLNQYAPMDLAFLLRRLDLMTTAYQHAKEQRDKYAQRVIGWREQCSLATRERDAALVQAKQLQGRLDTAEGRLAHFAAQHQPHDNLFKTCRTCKDGYGDPLPWPCADASDLGLGEEAGRG